MKRRRPTNGIEQVPRFGPQERALRVAMDKASVFASEKRHEQGLTPLQIKAVRITIPAIVSGLSLLDQRRAEAKRWVGEMTDAAYRDNEADAALWLLWLDVVRATFQNGAAQ